MKMSVLTLSIHFVAPGEERQGLSHLKQEGSTVEMERIRIGVRIEILEVETTFLTNTAVFVISQAATQGYIQAMK